MSRTRSGVSEVAVEAAISRVLAAERTAHDAIIDAQRRAGEIEEAGREQAKAVSTRTERRMLRACAAFEEATLAALAGIAAEVSPADRECPDDAERRALAGAVVQLAARLTGDFK